LINCFSLNKRIANVFIGFCSKLEKAAEKGWLSRLGKSLRTARSKKGSGDGDCEQFACGPLTKLQRLAAAAASIHFPRKKVEESDRSIINSSDSDDRKKSNEQSASS
jgi:hypothetical protein